MSRLVGVLADIHGDIFALDTALGRLREMGCDPILCAGDLIDIEPFGEEVVQRLKVEKVTCILGNHDRWALQFRHRRQDARKFFEPCSVSDVIGSGAELSHGSLVWLSTLPVNWVAELEGVRVAMWHARPGSDMEGIEKEKTARSCGIVYWSKLAPESLSSVTRTQNSRWWSTSLPARF